jgi:putative transposase
VDDGKDLPVKQEINENTTIGIDTGIKTFLTCSNGISFENNKFLHKSLKKLARLNRAHSRKKKDSKNKEKAKLKLARQHEKISNQRKDYIHKITHKLTNDKQIGTICVETLDIIGMMKTKGLSRNLSDVGLGLFYQTLAYKCEWQGINLIKIGQFEPSSKACSDCGEINKDLVLADRKWTCVCGAKHDRDLNAAINIKNFGLLSSKSILPMECRKVTPVEIHDSESMKQEISRLPTR